VTVEGVHLRPQGRDVQSVRCTEMPICSCVRNQGAPSSPRTTLLTAARAYAVLHDSIPARRRSTQRSVWCGYIKSGCGSIRTNVAFACKRELGSSVVRNTHKALTPPSAAATAATAPPTRLRDAPTAAATAAALRRHAGSVAAFVALGIFRSPRPSARSWSAATRKPDETLKTPGPWMSVQTMEAMQPAAQRPRQYSRPFSRARPTPRNVAAA
jgi:hypothetical protein